MDDVRWKMVLILQIMIYNDDEIDHKVSEQILVANTLSWPKGFSIMLRDNMYLFNHHKHENIFNYPT